MTTPTGPINFSDVQTEFGNAMQRVEQGKQDGAAAWDQLVGDTAKIK